MDIPVVPYGSSTSWAYHLSLSLNLTFSITDLENTVKALVSANAGDAPQSQLTALQQTCTRQELGWRAGSTRLIVLSTFSPFHQAGDFLNATGPNDGTLSNTLDYPSIEQVALACNAANITVLFLTTSDYVSTYSLLLGYFNNSRIALVQSDSSDFVNQFFNATVTAAPNCLLTSSANLPSGNEYVSCAESTFCATVKNTIPSAISGFLTKTICSGDVIRVSVMAVLMVLMLLIA